MSIFSKNPENYLDRADRIDRERETVYCENKSRTMKCNGSPVMVQNGMYNFWAWVSPISPFTQYIRQHGGYFQMRKFR